MSLREANHDKRIKCISNTGTIRGVAVNATHLTRELCELQKLSPMGATALGEALVAGFLYGSFCKVGERANLNIQGDGWAKQALVDAYPEGHVRGYVIENSAHPMASADAPLGPWGAGTLSVLRTKSLEKAQPYIGTVPLVTGYLAKDLTFYWHQSEQVPSAVGIAVNLDMNGKIDSVGGFMVQAMPGASPEEIRLIDTRVAEMGSLAHKVALEEDPMGLLSQIFQDQAFMVLESKPIHWECHCSWERVSRALTLVGSTELQSMLDTDGQASVRCDFCTKEYVADRRTLEELIQKAR